MGTNKTINIFLISIIFLILTLIFIAFSCKTFEIKRKEVTASIISITITQNQSGNSSHLMILNGYEPTSWRANKITIKISSIFPEEIPIATFSASEHRPCNWKPIKIFFNNNYQANKFLKQSTVAIPDGGLCFINTIYILKIIDHNL